jgi:hypothetical protein
MRRSIAVALSVGLFFLFYLSGCERSTKMMTQPDNPVSSQDQAAIANLISQDALFTTDATALNDGPAPLLKTDSAITPRFWGRWIQNASRDVVYDQVDDTTVVATITVNLKGQVWIRAKSTMRDTIFYKPLEESIVHKAKFNRFVGADTAHVRWKLVAVSGTEGGTTNGGIVIQNVTLFLGNDTVQVMDPLNTFFEFGHRFTRLWMPEFREDPAASFKVQVTVKSTDPDSDIVSAHRPIWFGMGCSYRRAVMSLVSSTPNGDGTFTRVYEHRWEGAFMGRYNAFVGTMTRQSIYDDRAPFSSSVWGIPFVIDHD